MNHFCCHNSLPSHFCSIFLYNLIFFKKSLLTLFVSDETQNRSKFTNNRPNITHSHHNYYWRNVANVYNFNLVSRASCLFNIGKAALPPARDAKVRRPGNEVAITSAVVKDLRESSL